MELITVTLLIERIKSNQASLISVNKEGSFFVNEANALKVCLVENRTDKPMGKCTLIIAKSYRLDNFVLSYRDKVERKLSELNVIYAELTELQALYNANRIRKGDINDEDSAAQKYVVRILKEATRINSSDVHIIVNNKHGLIRFRSNGSLVNRGQVSEQEAMMICATIYQSMSDVAEPTFRPQQAQRARMKGGFVNDIGLTGARINTRPLDSGYLMVLRLFYVENAIKTLALSDLGYQPAQCQTLEALCRFRSGIVLISGATGSGKSTTLKLVMEKLVRDDPGIHVLTLEDPPEYVIKGVNQSPIVGDRSNVAAVEQAWGQAIADAMRLDPDVIMIGEIRDSVSARMAFRAAMTGHLVWTTIHANTAMTILYRLKDEGVTDSLLTDETILIGLINQSLVPTLCEHCKVSFHAAKEALSENIQARITSTCETNSVYLTGQGCSHCNQTGVSGRTVVAEIISTTPQFMEVYRTMGHNAAGKFWREHLGGVRKMDAAICKINAGLVSPLSVEKILGPLC